jgi:hypothetical protein
MSILKKIKPFTSRAEELDKDSQNPEAPLIAYYFRMHAVNEGLTLSKDPKYGPPDPSINNTILGLLGRLETDKAALPKHSPAEGCRKIFDFANRLFSKADQSTTCDKSTARIFYTTSLFFDILDQFEIDQNGLTPEENLTLEYKRKYCKKRSTDIMNAVKSGITAEYISFEQYTSQTPTASGDGNEGESSTLPNDDGTSSTVLPTIPNNLPSGDIPFNTASNIPSSIPSSRTEDTSTSSFEMPQVPNVPTSTTTIDIPEAPTTNTVLDRSQIPEAPQTFTIPQAPFTHRKNSEDNLNPPPSYDNLGTTSDSSSTSTLNPLSSTTSTSFPTTSTVTNTTPRLPTPRQQIETTTTSVPSNYFASQTPQQASITSGTRINKNAQPQIIDDIYFAVTAAKHGDAQITEEHLIKALERLRSGC